MTFAWMTAQIVLLGMSSEIDTTPHRPVSELIGIWESRISREAAVAATQKANLDRYINRSRPQTLFDESDPQYQAIVRLRPPQGSFAKDRPHRAKFHLRRLFEPFGWGKRGMTRG